MTRTPAGPARPRALVVYALAFAGLLGIVLWRLWTEVIIAALASVPLV